MFKKIINFFRLEKAETITEQQPLKINPTAMKPKKPKVESTRIGELGEHKINIQLGQLTKEFRYLTDIMVQNPKARSGYSQIDHLVISPNGIFVIETKNYSGEIKGQRDDRYWTVSNRFKLFNPLFQNYGHIKALEGILSGRYPDMLYISMISFTMRCRFSIDPELRKIESNELVIYDVELSEYILRKSNRLRATTNNPILHLTEIESIQREILKCNITDPEIRATHIEKSKSK